MSSVIDIKPTSPVYLRRKASEFIVNVNPQYAGKTLTIDCDLEGADFEKVVVDIPEGGLKPGTCVSYNVGMTADPVLLSADGTANTYIVNKADCLYAFNAKVKGNGSTKSISWSYDGEPHSTAFDAALAPSSAELLWYSIPEGEGGFVNASPVSAGSVMYDDVDGLIYFKTPKTFVNGNAVIAALNESGEIVWSWNIWAVEGWDADATSRKAGRYTVMDRNLGAVISGVGSTGNYEPAYAVGNYYQWGRKDPFPSIADYCNYWPCEYANQLIGTPTYTPIVALRVNGQSAAKNVDSQVWGYRTKDDGSFNMDSSWHTIERNSIAAPSSSNRVFAGYAVEHPYVYILNPTYPDGGYYPWLTTNDQSYREFWGGSESNKTLFDPCPTGWRVCNKAEAESFMQTVSSTAALASNLVGYDFDGHYLPMTGTRGNKNMRTTNVRSCGYETKSYMWTSEILTSHNYGYAYTAAMIAPANYADAGKPNTLKMTTEGQDRYLTLACPVRCVKE